MIQIAAYMIREFSLFQLKIKFCRVEEEEEDESWPKVESFRMRS